MEQAAFRRLTGFLFVIAVIAFLITSSVLSLSFDWPDILREEPDYVLTEFEDGGTSLVWTWFAVGWSYFLLLFPVMMLRQVMEQEDRPFPYLGIATTLGVVSVIASLVGFLRWVFVMPGLAEAYTASGASEATRQGIVAAYTAQHQLAGTLLGEHLGQMLSIMWSILIGVAMLRSRLFQPGLGVFGIAASLVYLLGQGDILKTAVPSFPESDIGGLIGATAWGLWVLLVGIALMLMKPRGRAAT